MTTLKFFGCLRAFVVAAALILAVLWTTWLLVERSRLEAIEAKIRADGLATTPKEILPPPVVPEDNAAPLLDEAAAQLKALKDSGFVMRVPGLGNKKNDPALFDAEKLGELKAQMASPEVQSILNLLREASAKPACQFDRDYSKGPAVDTDGIIELFSGTQLLGLSAWLQAQEGNTTAAFEDILAMARLAAFGLEDPEIIGWQTGVGIDRNSIQQACLILGQTPPERVSVDQLRELRHLWATHAARARESLVRVLDTERVILGEWIFRTVSPLNRLNTVEKYPFYPLIIMDRRAYLESIISLRDRILTKPPGSLPIEDTDIFEQIPRLAILSRLASPLSFGYLRADLDASEVELQVAQAGLALEEWRANHVDYPATLKELGLPPDLLRDPFSDQPLVYRRTPEGVIVYSVGRDRADNGGIRSKKDQPGDIVWSVQRPAP